MKKNYYRILNVEFDASLDDIKKSYRRLALLYHPDKTENELLKSRFAEIKEAYEVLKDPVKRKHYDRSFDNFSYRREVQLTPYEILLKLRQIGDRVQQQDPYRMDLDKLEFDITELLSERNTDTLAQTPEKELVQLFITELLEVARPLTPARFKPISNHIAPLADAATKLRLAQFEQSHTWDNRWNNYKIVFAIAAGILLCVIMYYYGQ